MMNRRLLNDGWRLHEAPLEWNRDCLAKVCAMKDGWMDCNVPVDVHMPLQEYGRIGDVVEGDNCFGAEWIEGRSWWFVKEFDGAEIDLASDLIELTLESLDANADVFLNGTWLGSHQSTFYPFRKAVGDILVPGRNVLAVRLTTGLELVSDGDLAEIHWACSHERNNGCPERGDLRRPFVRKPQYSVGWDWGPKALTCGIMKDVAITTYRKTALRGVHVSTCKLHDGAADIRLELEIEQLDFIATRDADVEVTICFQGRECAAMAARDVLLCSGMNYISLTATIPEAQLWWPSGYGDHPLYTLRGRICCEGWTEEISPMRFGVRTVELDLSRVDEHRRNFFLRVNGTPVYCKGGDWIPADSIYARVTPEKYRALIEEAREANFNMLRVWGGGLYEGELFYNLCDENGLMIWHDMMFACSAYPDHREDFQMLVDRELRYQLARLRNHASVCLLCGNNEIPMMLSRENPLVADRRYEKQYGLSIFNRQFRTLAHALCPELPCWNSSPYGGDFANSDDVGNKHHWGECMMNRDMAKRIEPKEYDRVTSRFVTEYGYPGPCPIASMKQYLGGGEIDRASRVWEMHTNTFEKHTVNAGIEKHYLDGAESLSLEDYILYGGMVQSLMLGYSLEALRFKDFCGGGLFWMYNDTWGEVGWTIVDYYLRRKISYYGVKRAFAPVKLTLRVMDDEIVLQCANDTPNDLVIDAECGWMSFDGSASSLRKERLTLPARSRVYARRWPVPADVDFAGGTFVAIPRNDSLDPAVLRMLDVRQMRLTRRPLRVIDARMEGEDAVFTLEADAFVHGAYIETDCRCSDNYFDLLPGQRKVVRVFRAGNAQMHWKQVR